MRCYYYCRRHMLARVGQSAGHDVLAPLSVRKHIIISELIKMFERRLDRFSGGRLTLVPAAKGMCTG